MKLKTTVILFIIIATICNLFFLAFNHYKRSNYAIFINDIPINYHIKEKSVIHSIPYIVTSRKWEERNVISNTKKQINEMYLNNPVLDIKTFNCYNRYNNKHIGCLTDATKGTEVIQKEKDVVPTHLKITKKNEIIYDSKYIDNIGDYIKEEGRYYFDVKIKIKNGLNNFITSDITFNVKFVGVDYE